jgi:hypothetical protein
MEPTGTWFYEHLGSGFSLHQKAPIAQEQRNQGLGRRRQNQTTTMQAITI